MKGRKYSHQFLLLQITLFSILCPRLLSLNLMMSSQRNSPLFSFGLIADIQYANSPDAYNFQGTSMRRYRQSLEIFKEASSYWDSNKNIDFSLILGDVIDGKTTYSSTSQKCLEEILAIKESARPKFLFCFGNHCHYAMSRETMSRVLCPQFDQSSEQQIGGECSPEKLFYDWSPAPQWRFISLDSYDVSLIGSSSKENKMLAKELIKENNPNDVTQSGTWFNDLPFEKMRWVPYNGGVGDSQLQWLDRVLTRSKENQEKVVIFCHQPVYSHSKPNSLVWNSEEILSVLWRAGNVCMWVAGHDHGGQYSIDPTGIHHLVPAAPIECDEGEKSFGHIDVFPDELHLHWRGKIPKNSILPWPKIMKI